MALFELFLVVIFAEVPMMEVAQTIPQPDDSHVSVCQSASAALALQSSFC